MNTRTEDTTRAAEAVQVRPAAGPCPLLALQGGNPRPDCACGRTTAQEYSCPEC
jgi:hypothetical protein